MVSPTNACAVMQIGELHLAVKRIDVIPILIDLVISNGDDDVADLQTRFGRRHFRFNAGHVNAGRFAGLLRQICAAADHASGRIETERKESHDSFAFRRLSENAR